MPPEPGRGLGDELVRIHDGMRAELAALLDGSPLDRQLKARCLLFCGTLHEHHVGETERGFPLLEGQFPELKPVLDQLRREHDTVARLQGELEDTVRQGGDTRARLSTLAAELTAHFDREEQQLVAALNRIRR